MRRRIMSTAESNTVLLLHFDNNLVDSSCYKHSVTNSGLSFVTGKFGQAVKGGSGYLTLPSDIFRHVFTKDYTIDYWCYVNNTVAEKFDFVFQSNTWESGYCAVRFEVYKQMIRFFATDSGYPWDMICSYNVNLTGWNHIALVRKEYYMNIYVNGSLLGNFYYGYSSFPSGYINNWIGSGYKGVNKTENYIDEFRVSDIARWTSNFIPPTKPY